MLNGYNNHNSYEFEYYCKENNIVTFYISSYLSYLFQSFDIGCFNILKRLYGKGLKTLYGPILIISLNRTSSPTSI